MRDENTLALFPDRPSTSPVEEAKANQTPAPPRKPRVRSEFSAPTNVPARPCQQSADKRPGRGRQVATEDYLLTVDEFAESLRVTRACVRRWILERKVGVV